MGIWENLLTTANEAYSRGLHTDVHVGAALQDLNLPDSLGKIGHNELDLSLMQPLAQTILFKAARTLSGLSLYVIINKRNQNLIVPQMRVSLNDNLRGIQRGEIDPQAVAPYNEFVGSLAKAGELLTLRAGQIITRQESSAVAFKG